MARACSSALVAALEVYCKAVQDHVMPWELLFQCIGQLWNLMQFRIGFILSTFFTRAILIKLSLAFGSRREKTCLLRFANN